MIFVMNLKKNDFVFQAQEAHQGEVEEENDHIPQVYPDQGHDQGHVQGQGHCLYRVPQVNLSEEKEEDTKLQKLQQKN